MTNPGRLLGVLPVAEAGWRTDNSCLRGHGLGAPPRGTGEMCIVGAGRQSVSQQARC